MGLTIGQQQVLTVPASADTLPIFHQANQEGYQVSIATLATIFQGQVIGGIVFDITNYGAVAGGPDSTAAFTLAQAAAVAAGGGTIYIPPGQFYKASTTVISSAIPINITGSGGGSEIVMTTNSDAFQASSSANDSGMFFRDFHISYFTGATSGNAINVNNGNLVAIQNMYFTDAPCSIYVFNGLQVIIDSVLIVNDTNPSPAGCIQLGEAAAGAGATVNECFISNVLAHCGNNSQSAGSIGLACYRIQGLFVQSVKFSYYTPGIYISPYTNCNDLYFEEVVIDSPGLPNESVPGTGNSVLIEIPASFPGSSALENCNFTDCKFHYDLTNSDGAEPNIDNVLINTNGFANSFIDNVNFTNCQSYDATGSGCNILGGTRIQFTGGDWSSNTLAGITVNAAKEVFINGVNLDGNILTHPNTQNYGVVVINGANQVNVIGGTAQGNALDPFYVDSTTSNVTIKAVNAGKWTDNMTGFVGNRTGDTTVDLLFAIPVPGGSMFCNANGYITKQTGSITLTSTNTAEIFVLVGGNSLITLGGTYAISDTIEYTLNSHNVTLTVLTGQTSLTNIASNLAAAINADGTDGALVTATPSTNAVTGAVTIQIASKLNAWQQGEQLANSVTVTSSLGTGTMNGNNLIDLIATYTTAELAGTDAYRMDLTFVGNGNSKSVATNGLEILVGTAIVKNVVGQTSCDLTIDQNIEVYTQLAASANSFNNNVFASQRL